MRPMKIGLSCANKMVSHLRDVLCLLVTVSSENHTFVLGKLDLVVIKPVLCAHTFACN